MPRGGIVLAWAPRLTPALIGVATAALFTALALTSSLSTPFLAWDSHAYWTALRSADPYTGVGVGEIGAFLYPPPFLQFLAPAGLLPWPVFLFAWTSILATACVSLLRRVPDRFAWMMPLLVYMGGADVWAGNINVLLAYAIVIGLERPALWSVVALTKLTPGVGALWHAFRREWRAVVIAAATTGGLVLLSWAMAPHLWGEWIAAVAFGSPIDGYSQAVPIPLAVRLPLAVGLLWWGARIGRPAVVPLACLLALPVIWFNGFALALGSAVLQDLRIGRSGERAVWDSNPRHED